MTMNLHEITKVLHNCAIVLQDNNIFNELLDNDNSRIHLLKKCCNNIIKIENICQQDIQTNLFKITSVIDAAHEDLHIGHWSSVPAFQRKLYSFSIYIKILYLLLAYSINRNQKDDVESLQLAIKLGDMALMLGDPLQLYPNLINDMIKFLMSLIHNANNKREKIPDIPDLESGVHDNIQGIDIIDCPSIEYFKNSYFDLQHPALLKNCINHWPAITKWRSLDYIKHIAGNRTVPVELGSKYTDESWSQKLMTINEFIDDCIVNNSTESAKGYLAQHQLLDQIPELAQDICIPDYCCISNDEYNTPEINVWFGPKGTISPLHTDPKHNLLAQVFGVKQIVLFSPDDNEFLYPHDETLLNNTSQVDLENPDLNMYPLFVKATPITCTLRPGDMIYIPPKWWHHVTSKTISFSVSFWWE